MGEERFLDDADARMRKEDRPRSCPLCKRESVSFEVVGEFVYGGRREQRFYECPSCDVAFLSPQPSPQEEAEFYAREFEKFMEKRSGETGAWTGPEAHVAANQDNVRRRLAVIQRELSVPRQRILEVGCSSGFMLLALRDMGMEVMGVEPSGGFTRFIRGQNIPVYESLDKFEIPTGTVGALDLIIHFFVLEHVRYPLAFLEQCLALLKPTGTVFFEVPSRSDPLITIYKIDAFQKFYWSAAHYWYFNRNSLEYLCRRLPCEYELIPEQRYDLSNHMWWALTGKAGGSAKFSDKFTGDLEQAYKASMRQTGRCDTLFVKLKKSPVQARRS